MKCAIKLVFICFALLGFMCCHIANAMTCTGDDIIATNAALIQTGEPELTFDAQRSKVSRASMFASKGSSNKTAEYIYYATGDLSSYASGSDITLNFEVTDYFVNIKSATIALLAYDVDYPSATEADITYLNGHLLGWRLQGGNNEWHENDIPIKNLSILKTPKTIGEPVQNTFFVDVNATNEGWVTCISKAILVIEGEVGIKVDASDGTEVGGVLVEWSEIPGATYTLWRGEKRGEKTDLLFSGPLTEYFDETADQKICYYYTVEATQTSNVSLYSTQKSGFTASDDGYHDMLLPNIEKIELPEFWLENRAPLKITWNGYNPDIFKITECMVELTGPTKRKEELPTKEFAPNSPFIFDFAEKKTFSDKDFGEYTVVVTWDVDLVSWKGTIGALNRIRCLFDKSTEEKKIKLFFDKYGKEEIPNWYNYWPKMGAIAKGYIGDNAIFKFNPELKNARGACNSPNKAEAAVKYPITTNKAFKCPNIYYDSPYDVSKIAYSVSPTAATQKREYTLNDGTKVSKEAQGLEALALVLTHELKHGELYEKYCSGISEKRPLIATPLQNSNAKTIDELVEQMETLAEFNTTEDKDEYKEAIKNYANTILDIVEKGKYTSDLDGDLVLDNEEDESLLFTLTLRGNPDSRGVVAARNNVDNSGNAYKDYGDNEAFALREERLSPVSFYPSKDWAFPGSNCRSEYSFYPPIGPVEIRDEKGNVVRTTTWDKEKEEILRKVFEGFETSPIAMGSSMQSYSAMALASEEKSSRTGGDLTTLPSLYEYAEEGLSIEGDVLDQTADYTVANGYSALAISIPFVNSGEAISAAEVSGYLINEKDEPVAFAQTVSDLPIGKTDVILEFPGDSLQKIKSASYQLALVQVEVSHGDLGMTLFSKTELADNTFAYTNMQFTGNSANYVYNTFSEEKTQDGLLVEVKGIVTTPGVYHLEARLEGADGDLVSHVGYEQEFTAGEMTASFVFPNEEIYLSRQNGPYDICFVRISQDGVVLDERRMPYQTSTYSYTDFTPENVCLVIDESSFKRGDDVVGTDGLITNLSFSFDVDYQGEEEMQCQGRLYLYGDDDRIVTVSQEVFSLVKGRNTLEFIVDGYSIQKSEVNGPYVIKKIRLEPQDGAAEIFEPTIAPIELNSEDFGAYPFSITGNIDFTENEGGYELAVPLEILRANSITLTAMLVEENGKYVTSATSTKTYSDSCEDTLKLVFTEAEINASERKGPYTVRFVQIKTDIPGISSVDIPVPEAAKEISKAYTRYVDCLNESDICDGYTWETAFRTIQEAVDIADPGDLILVADGVYSPFTTNNKEIWIQSVNGYEKTFIDGEGRERCATLGYEQAHQNTVLEGFTLMNGDASTERVLVLWNCGGGVCCGSVLNCRITNCLAEKGGASYYGFLENCLLDWNEATAYGGGAYYGVQVNCTIVDNCANSSGGGTYQCTNYNSIVWGNIKGSTSYTLDNYDGGDFYYSNTYPIAPGIGNIAFDPQFRDWKNQDYRLSSTSVCEDAGYIFSDLGTTDLMGNPRICGDGIDMGAYEFYRSCYQSGLCDFVEEDVIVNSSSTIAEIGVFGGRLDQACSVQLNLIHNTTSPNDIVGIDDGVFHKNLKFPYTITWEAGEVGKKTITFMFADDLAVEDDEFLTLQLLNPVGMTLGEFKTCTVKVYDQNTSQTLGQAIQNTALNPKTSGSGKWIAEDGNRAVEQDDTYNSYAVSPIMGTGKQSTLSLAPVSGPGTLYFSLKFVGTEDGDVPSKLSVYNGRQEIGWLTPASQDEDWNTWTVSIRETGKHTLSFKFTQGTNSLVQARITWVYWIPDSASYSLPLILESSPSEGGYTIGSGVFQVGTKMPVEAIARPGWEFVGWYTQMGNLFNEKIKQNLYFTESANDSVTLIAQFRKIPYVRGLADSVDGGKITGSNYCATGKKVTLKASANKNFTFKGWYATRRGSSNLIDLTQCVAMTPSLVIDRTGKPAKNTKTSTTITGVNDDVTYFALFEGDPRVQISAMPLEAGKVTGLGRYALGQKVTLKATANKGYVFAGWYQDADFTTPCSSELVDYRTPSYTYVMGEEDVEFYARFIPIKEDDVLNLSVNGTMITDETVRLTTAETEQFVFTIDSNSLPKVSVKGMPKGMKFTNKPLTVKATKTTPEYSVPINTLYGTSTTPGIYTVTVSLTNTTIKKAITKTFEIQVPNFTDGEIQVKDSYGPYIPGDFCIEEISVAEGCTVSGLPAGLKWTAKDIYKKGAKTDVETSANSVYGVPTKPGFYTVTFTKTVNKVKHMATSTFIIAPFPQLNVIASTTVDGAAMGKVTGMGGYLAGKQVTLKATANKGYVFAGWYQDADFTTPCSSELVDYRNPSYAYVMGVADTELYARFVTKAEEAEHEMAIALCSLEYPDLTLEEYVFPAGEPIAPIWVMVDSLTLPKVTVKGLPKGLKFDAKTLTILGTPTTSGEYVVTVEATNASKSWMQITTFYFTISP